MPISFHLCNSSTFDCLSFQVLKRSDYHCTCNLPRAGTSWPHRVTGEADKPAAALQTLPNACAMAALLRGSRQEETAVRTQARPGGAADPHGHSRSPAGAAAEPPGEAAPRGARATGGLGAGPGSAGPRLSRRAASPHPRGKALPRGSLRAAPGPARSPRGARTLRGGGEGRAARPGGAAAGGPGCPSPSPGAALTTSRALLVKSLLERAVPRLSSSSLALSPAVATPSALLRVFTVFTLALKSRVMSTAMAAAGAAARPSPRNAAPRGAFRLREGRAGPGQAGIAAPCEGREGLGWDCSRVPAQPARVGSAV